MIVSAGKPDKDQRVDIEKRQLPIPTVKQQKFGRYLVKSCTFRLQLHVLQQKGGGGVHRLNFLVKSLF